MLKKTLSALVLISFLAVLAVPMVVSAAIAPDEPEEMAGECTTRRDFSGWEMIDCPPAGTVCKFNDTTYDCPTCCLMDAIYRVTDWIFVGVLSLVVIFVLIGAFNLLTAAGSPEKVKSGRDFIIWAMVGAIVAALAKAIPAIVKAILVLG